MELFYLFSLIRSKNFFRNIMFIWSNDSKTCFKNKKWNYLTHFRFSDQETSLKTLCSFDPRKWNYFTYIHSKDSKTSFRNRKWIFLNRKWNYSLISRSRIKKFFKYLMLIWSKDFKISFRHKKINHFTGLIEKFNVGVSVIVALIL